MIIALIVAGTCAFTAGYILGSAPIRKEMNKETTPKEWCHWHHK